MPNCRRRGNVCLSLPTFYYRRDTLLANAQILRGKLARAHNSPVRDVFDIICAAKADPQALATATGMLNAQQAERIATRWRTTNKDFADEASTELRDVRTPVAPLLHLREGLWVHARLP